MRFTLAYKSEIVTPSLSDLVALGILSKPISEFTNDDIETIVSIPYIDESGIISGPIEFEVVGVNHHKDISDESKPTITLMTKNIIRPAAFDALEPNNPDSNRAKYGNNRWSMSNIRQWLNSEYVANEWFTTLHKYDEAPTTDKVNNDAGAYADEPGFLAGFSNEIKQHFATISNKTILCNADKLTFSPSQYLEITEDKVFLPSYTEMGFGNLDDNNPEGNHLARRFQSNNSRVKNGANGWYWIRSPYRGHTYSEYDVRANGSSNISSTCNGNGGIAPLIVLC